MSKMSKDNYQIKSVTSHSSLKTTIILREKNIRLKYQRSKWDLKLSGGKKYE